MGAARRREITAAWHEAGHIVVGTHFGFRLTRASITPRRTADDDLSCGWTEWEPGSWNIMAMIRTSLAGQAVEERLYGPGRHSGTRDDQAVIQAFARLYKAARKSGRIARATHIPRLTALYREQPDRVPLEVKRIADELVNKAMPETVRVLNERWSEVEAVASLLLKHTVVTPELLSSRIPCGRGK